METSTARAINDPAADFYIDALKKLQDTGIPFLLGGAFAFSHYSHIPRETKDIDVFCRPGDYPRILHLFQENGYTPEIEDERWIAKVRKGDDFFDVIFNRSTANMPITDDWFAGRHKIAIYGVEVHITPPTELVWSKLFIQDRYRYDGADVAHVILKKHEEIDWHWLLAQMELYWEVLLINVLNFRFVYPTERHLIPRWLYDELLTRLKAQAKKA